MITAPPPLVVPIIVYFADAHWRAKSVDGLYLGVFASRHAAVREATAEAEAHAGHICLIEESDADH